MIHPDDEPCRGVDFDASPHNEEQPFIDYLERPIDDDDPGCPEDFDYIDDGD